MSINFSLYCISFPCNRVPSHIVHAYDCVINTSNVECSGKCVVLGKAMQSHVHRQHDGVGKIKYRKEFRSRYATFVYYNHNRVACECHTSRRRDRERCRTYVKKLKRLSQKSRKLRVFVWKRILKVTPLSSKLHGYIG